MQNIQTQQRKKTNKQTKRKEKKLKFKNNLPASNMTGIIFINGPDRLIHAIHNLTTYLHLPVPEFFFILLYH